MSPELQQAISQCRAARVARDEYRDRLMRDLKNARQQAFDRFAAEHLDG